MDRTGMYYPHIAGGEAAEKRGGGGTQSRRTSSLNPFLTVFRITTGIFEERANQCSKIIVIRSAEFTDNEESPKVFTTMISLGFTVWEMMLHRDLSNMSIPRSYVSITTETFMASLILIIFLFIC
jgi:hypothetical protein